MLTRSSLAITLLALGCSADLDGVVSDTPTGSTGDASTGASSAGGDPTSGGGGEGPGAGNPGGAGPGGGGPGASGPGGGGPGGAGGAVGFCGDDVLDPATEDCDDDDFGGADCVDVGFPLGGALDCNDDCTFDLSNCETGSCGNGIEEAGEACDDNNNEPNDGCSPTCQLQGATCGSAIDVPVSAGITNISGNTETSGSASAPPNCTGGGAGAGPEIFFRLVPDQGGILTLTLFPEATEFDSVLYARPACDGAQQIACHDNFNTTNGSAGGEVLSFPVVPNVPVIVVVDGYMVDDAGDFTLNIDLSSGDNCSDVVPIHLDGDVAPPIRGTTQTGWSHDTNPAVPCVPINNMGIDMVYEITTPNAQPNSNVSVEASFDTIVYSRSTCNGAQISCDSGFVGDPEIDVNFSTTPRYVWVDTNANAGGTFRLHADIDP